MYTKNSSKIKLMILVSIIVIYILVGLGLKFAADKGIIPKATPLKQEIQGDDSIKVSIPDYKINLESAQIFFKKEFVEPSGHVDLYLTINQNKTIYLDNNTNSEAISYYLLWAANDNDQHSFDKEMEYEKEYMIQPDVGYMMWKLTANDTVENDGANMASDADLRTTKALLIAESKWGNKKYSIQIEKLASALKKVAITNDGYLAPYGGASGNSIWTADEIWLSYSDFNVFEELSKRFGSPWKELHDKMKKAALNAQLANGLYNSQLTNTRQYGNSIDGNGYSINSMWMMIRSAESNDPELKTSALKSLNFYKQKFMQDGELYAEYSSSGDALSPSDAPWVYALVGRAAIALSDTDFANAMLKKLVEHQITDKKSKLYGSFPEGNGDNLRIGQFTMQESILTLQAFLMSNGQK